MTVLIVGCGYVGSRIAQHYREQNESVVALVRSHDRREVLQASGILTMTHDLETLTDDTQFDGKPYTRVCYFVPPPAGDMIGVDPRMTMFLNHLQTLPAPEKMLYISTTGVYGDCQGEWITEDAPVKPESLRAKRRFDAEQQLLHWCERHKTHLIILRVAGIYGPSRLPLERLRQALPVLSESDSPPSNRVHVDDLVTICVTALRVNLPKVDIFNVADGYPTSMTDYFNKVALAAKIPLPPCVSWAEAEQVMTPAMLSFLTESKKIDNRKLLSSLMIQLRYPTVEKGLASCF